MAASSLVWSPNVLFARCVSLHHLSSSLPRSKNLASPVIVVEMLLSALVFRFSNRLARLLRVAAAGGLPLRPSEELEAMVGGRCETQSCTSRLTRGLDCRFRVLSDWALVVIMMVGPYVL